MARVSALILALVLTGCGSTNGPPSDDPGTDAQPDQGQEIAPGHRPEEEPTMSPPTPAPELVGHYELELDPDDSWHHHFLEILEVSEEGLRGIVMVDRGIGPQSRMPNPDEASHLLAFLAEPSEDPHRLVFRVKVGMLEPETWSFDLHFHPDAEPGKPRLTGKVRVVGSWDRELEATGNPAERSETLRLPAWQELPRGDLE